MNEDSCRFVDLINRLIDHLFIVWFLLSVNWNRPIRERLRLKLQDSVSHDALQRLSLCPGG